MIRASLAALTVVLVATACSGGAGSGNASPSPSAPAGAPQNGGSLANGRLIFLTGRDAAGVQIRAAQRPLRQSCAACHGASGAGGVHFPGGAVSADLRHKALVTNQKPPYNIALLERAISTGVDNTGQPLNPVMPRWKLSQRDLHDVAQYVLAQLK